MQKKLRVMQVAYPDIQVPQWQGRKLRGFFASDMEPGSFLHNHGKAGSGIYRYPLVQYKIVGRTPTILAIEEGVREVDPLVMDRQELLLGAHRYPCGHVDIGLRTEPIGDTAKPQSYRFCSPWFGLNQSNYRSYVQAGSEERKAILSRVLVGNLLSLAKGLGLRVENRLEVQLRLNERPVRFKDEVVLGFLGTFSVNYLIPDLFGSGKSVSCGFGNVRRTVSRKERDA
ncbi:MAG: hypothetical protein K2K53_03750 [Oscillospiraceae bacterium]|nr:hypothetical protein [Oscillospiraceae bacterium]